ncbi:MAG: hypothetical protein QNJ67_18780 [Kiloniellales bacterium]|nr:hypothetical protein [Kiloniellales bacterium]
MSKRARRLPVALLLLTAACGPRLLTTEDVAAMTETEKVSACQEAYALRTRTTSECLSAGGVDQRRLCRQRVRWHNNIGVTNYVILDCTRVDFLE